MSATIDIERKPPTVSSKILRLAHTKLAESGLTLNPEQEAILHEVEELIEGYFDKASIKNLGKQ
jgi:hypothetical protein